MTTAGFPNSRYDAKTLGDEVFRIRRDVRPALFRKAILSSPDDRVTGCAAAGSETEDFTKANSTKASSSAKGVFILLLSTCAE